MPENPTFVVNDRRKFTSEGDLRHDLPVDPSATATTSSTTEQAAGPQLVDEIHTSSASAAELNDLPESQAIGQLYPDAGLGVLTDSDETQSVATIDDFTDDGELPRGPTEEQATEAARAYTATIERLDFAMRSANPGGERMPEMTFDRLVQSLYTQALILLGGGAQPGETPRVDILGARETIDMLSVLADKSKSNLSAPEDKLLQSALFDLRMGFLEITQALARQAAQRQPGPGGLGGMTPAGAGPRIVR